jgi:NitT/TauT family transport system substrate-binding protein
MTRGFALPVTLFRFLVRPFQLSRREKERNSHAVTAFACCAAILLAQAPAAYAQSVNALIKVRYEEVIRSLFYLPQYVALSKGYFKEAGLDVTIKTSQGSDKGVAALLSDSADIVLIGPEAAIFVHNSESPVKPKIFASLTAMDGFILMARHKPEKFEWSMLKGKDVMGFRPNSSPEIFFEEGLKRHGLDIKRDLKLNTNIAAFSRMGAWLAGQNDYAIFAEPDASLLEQDGKAHALTVVGAEVGRLDYTVFAATDVYIKKNPRVVQAWTDAVAKSLRYVESAPTQELVAAAAEFFPGLDRKIMANAIERYRKYEVWKKNPLTEPAGLDRFQDVLISYGVLRSDKRVRYEDIVVTDFAKKAK